MRLRVPSKRYPDVRHTVELQGSQVRCTCPGFYFKHKCWHVVVMKELLAYRWQMRLQAKALGGMVCS
ncbi:MAG: hypothetical protein HZB92_05295 [Euryarchaeota archaeon]|nr:hypothetical protein [Euryarchaeota archaeon]